MFRLYDFRVDQKHSQHLSEINTDAPTLVPFMGTFEYNAASPFDLGGLADALYEDLEALELSHDPFTPRQKTQIVTELLNEKGLYLSGYSMSEFKTKVDAQLSPFEEDELTTEVERAVVVNAAVVTLSEQHARTMDGPLFFSTSLLAHLQAGIRWTPIYARICLDSALDAVSSYATTVRTKASTVMSTTIGEKVKSTRVATAVSRAGKAAGRLLKAYNRRVTGRTSESDTNTDS